MAQVVRKIRPTPEFYAVAVSRHAECRNIHSLLHIVRQLKHLQIATQKNNVTEI